MEDADGVTKIKDLKYKDKRPEEYFQRFHQRARTKEPGIVYTLARWIFIPLTKLLFRADARGVGNVPLTGPVILAPNHASNMDHFLVGRFLKSRKVRFMAKSQMFKWPMWIIYSNGGVFPVRRGNGDEEAMKTAGIILKQNGLLLMYPQGSRSRSSSFEQTAKPGVGRLALGHGVPVVPVAIYGSDKIRNWKKLRLPPKIVVSFGEPIYFAKDPTATGEEISWAAAQVLNEVYDLFLELNSEMAKAGKQKAQLA